MKIGRSVPMMVIAAFVAAGASGVQETKKPQEAKPQGAPAGAPQMPKPGPAHEILKGDVGTWEATVETWEAADQPPQVSQGSETNTLIGGGLWLVTDFKADMMGQPFQGHGVAGYDPMKKKYVSTWVDSMSSGIGAMEATYDPTTKKMTGWYEGPDETGKVVKMKTVCEWKDADTRVFTMYKPAAPGAKEQPGMRITYKRKK